MVASSFGRVHVSITPWCGFSCAPPLLPEPRFEKRRHIRASVRVHLTTTPLGSCWRKPCAWSPDQVQTLADFFTPLGPLQRCCQAWDLYFASAFFFPSLSSWHLPKVLILQSASARAGADRTFSDQYLGQVPRVKEDHLAREPEKAGIECISHGGSGETWLLRRGSVWDGSRGLLGSMNLFLSTTFQGL